MVNRKYLITPTLHVNFSSNHQTWFQNKRASIYGSRKPKKRVLQEIAANISATYPKHPYIPLEQRLIGRSDIITASTSESRPGNSYHIMSPFCISPGEHFDIRNNFDNFNAITNGHMPASLIDSSASMNKFGMGANGIKEAEQNIFSFNNNLSSIYSGKGTMNPTVPASGPVCNTVLPQLYPSLDPNLNAQPVSDFTKPTTCQETSNYNQLVRPITFPIQSEIVHNSRGNINNNNNNTNDNARVTLESKPTAVVIGQNRHSINPYLLPSLDYNNQQQQSGPIPTNLHFLEFNNSSAILGSSSNRSSIPLTGVSLQSTDMLASFNIQPKALPYVIATPPEVETGLGLSPSLLTPTQQQLLQTTELQLQSPHLGLLQHSGHLKHSESNSIFYRPWLRDSTPVSDATALYQASAFAYTGTGNLNLYPANSRDLFNVLRSKSSTVNAATATNRYPYYCMYPQNILIPTFYHHSGIAEMAAFENPTIATIADFDVDPCQSAVDLSKKIKGETEKKILENPGLNYHDDGDDDDYLHEEVRQINKQKTETLEDQSIGGE